MLASSRGPRAAAGVRGRDKSPPLRPTVDLRPNRTAATTRTAVGRDALIPPDPAAAQTSAGGYGIRPDETEVSDRAGGVFRVCPRRFALYNPRPRPTWRPGWASGCAPGRSGCTPPAAEPLHTPWRLTRALFFHIPQLGGSAPSATRCQWISLTLPNRFVPGSRSRKINTFHLSPDQHQRGFDRAGGQLFYRLHGIASFQ